MITIADIEKLLTNSAVGYYIFVVKTPSENENGVDVSVYSSVDRSKKIETVKMKDANGQIVEKTVSGLSPSLNDARLGCFYYSQPGDIIYVDGRYHLFQQPVIGCH